MNKSENAVMEYARNRTELRGASDAIQKLICPTGNFEDYGEIDLNPHREMWLEVNNGNWATWEDAVTQDEYTDVELQMAKLLDIKAYLRREAGQLKRNIYLIGAGLNRQKESVG